MTGFRVPYTAPADQGTDQDGRPRSVRFGFKVVRQREQAEMTGSDIVASDLWSVELPHQCDSWEITDPEETYCGPVEHARAVELMRAFVDQAQEALRSLEQRKENKT